MEILVWNCLSCGKPIVPDEGIEINSREWETYGAAILPDNKIIRGKVNLLGMFGKEVIYDGKADKPETYHEFCYQRTGAPTKYTKPGESSPMGALSDLFKLIKLVKKMGSEASKKISANLEREPNIANLALTHVRISGDGRSIEQFSVIKDLIEKVCHYDFAFDSQIIPQCQAEMARQWAQKWEDNSRQAEQFDPGKKQNCLELVNLNLKIAEVFERASEEVKELSKSIKEQTQALDEEILYHEHELPSRNISDIINRQGWAVIVVGGEISFAYTIGLSKNFKHPEIIATAIGQQQASSLLNYLAEQVKEGVRYDVGKVHPKTEESSRHVFIKVANKFYRDYMGQAMNYYNGLHFPVIQRVITDKQELFPWEDGCDPVTKFAQKILGKVELATDL